MAEKITRVGLVQMSCGPDPEANLEKAAERVRDAARQILRMMHSGNHRQLALHQAPQQALHGRSLLRVEAGERLVQQ